MNSLLRELYAHKGRLEQAIAEAEAVLSRSPEGSLRVNIDGKYARYYHITQKGDVRGDYIRAGERNLAEQLAKKDYSRKVLAEARDELHGINECIRTLTEHNTETVYSNLIEPRRKLVTPILRDEEQRILTWNKVPYQVSTYKEEEKVFPTKRGEKVRSKSELIIADMYYDLGIPYRYECELKALNGENLYPDFTLYHVHLRTVFYHEHLGCLDKEEYRQRNMRKFRLYEDLGYIPGKNMIVTWESDKFPFNIQSFRKQIKEIFWL